MSNKTPPIVNNQPITPNEDWDDPDNDPSLHEAPIVIGLLQPVPGDPHRNVVPRAMQLAGLVLRLRPWNRGTEVEDEILSVFVDNKRVFIDFYPRLDPLPDPVVIDLGPKSALQSHGVKDIDVHVINSSGNPENYNTLRVYVDVQDPNQNVQPGIIEFEDYGSELTPGFLVGKTGLTCTIPEPADRRGGDTYRIWVGDSTVSLDGTVPLTGPITVIIPTNIILAKAGVIEVAYSLTDRGGTATVRSLPNYVRVSLNEAPVFGTISVLEGPLIDKEEARNGVTVRLQTLTGHLPNDVLVARWGTVEIYRQSIGMAIVPIDIPANYAAIADGGNFYTATVQLTIERTGGPIYPAAPVMVDVDLREPGTTNPGEGPVDPALAKPQLIGGGPLPSPPNRLSEKDRGFDATATFLLPEGLESGDFIDLVYKDIVVGTYPVTGTEAVGFLVPFTVDWDDIDTVGNGTIMLYCVIRDAVNYKHSPHEDVIVEIFNLAGLADAAFIRFRPVTGNPNYNALINCTHVPWTGVPIKVLDPLVLKVNDRVIVEATRYAFPPVGMPIGAPVGTPVESAEFTIDSSHVNLGLDVPLNLNAWFEDFTGTNGRGIVGIRWKLFRPSTGDRGISDEVRAGWDLFSTGSTPPTCVPGATRRSGTL